MEEFITIKETIEMELVEKRSKFIAHIFYVETTSQAEEFIKKTKKKYFDARHNCVAYRIIEDGKIIERFSDDGEPSGTAGGPMLNILQKRNLANVLVVVTRYFGGILLGTGGLVRAYSDATLKAIESSKKICQCIGEEIEVTLTYNYFETFKHYCKNSNIKIITTQYLENIICKIELEENVKQKLIADYETKKINLIDLKSLGKKYITKSVLK